MVFIGKYMNGEKVNEMLFNKVGEMIEIYRFTICIWGWVFASCPNLLEILKYIFY